MHTPPWYSSFIINFRDDQIYSHRAFVQEVKSVSVLSHRDISSVSQVRLHCFVHILYPCPSLVPVIFAPPHSMFSKGRAWLTSYLCSGLQMGITQLLWLPLLVAVGFSGCFLSREWILVTQHPHPSAGRKLLVNHPWTPWTLSLCSLKRLCGFSFLFFLGQVFWSFYNFIEIKSDLKWFEKIWSMIH